MKALTTAGLTKLIQLIKSSFISVDNTVTTSTVTLATVATSGSYTDLSNKPTEIPSQSGQSGKYLTTNGTSVSWATVPTLPSQTGQSGKYLTTNGTSASWTTITIPTVNNATLTIQQNGTTVNTFTANASSDVTANIQATQVIWRTYS